MMFYCVLLVLLHMGLALSDRTAVGFEIDVSGANSSGVETHVCVVAAMASQ